MIITQLRKQKKKPVERPMVQKHLRQKHARIQHNDHFDLLFHHVPASAIRRLLPFTVCFKSELDGWMIKQSGQYCIQRLSQARSRSAHLFEIALGPMDTPTLTPTPTRSPQIPKSCQVLISTVRINQENQPAPFRLCPSAADDAEVVSFAEL